MPINNGTNLKVETNLAGETVVNESWHERFYKRNSQHQSEDAPSWSQAHVEKEVEPKPQVKRKSRTKTTSGAAKRSTTPKQDQALTNANKKDLNNRNLK